MRCALSIVVLAGCGRVSFDAVAAAGGPDATPEVDATTACGGVDGTCPAGCTDANDPDCPTCGDGVCEGNAGEMCVSCAADCKTTTAVCGNGACDPSEVDGSCEADCGPSPWPWTQEQTDLLAMINAMRASGFTCPSGSMPAAPALTPATFQPGAREWGWELAHQKFFMMGGTVCNGRTFAQRATAGGYQGGINAGGPNTTSIAAALNVWQTNAQCMALMNASYTRAEVAVAHDADNSYVVLFD